MRTTMMYRRRRWFGVMGLVLGLGGVWGCGPRESRLSGARRALVLERLTLAAVERVSGGGVLVIGNPFAHGPGANGLLRQADDEAVDGVKRALARAGGRYVGLAVPRLREEARRDPTQVALPPGASTPLSFMTEAGAWDGLRAAHPDAGLWISLIGVPADLATTRAWTDAGGPRWALYLPDLRLLGGAEGVGEAFRSGRLVAMVLAKPGAPPESEPMKADPAEEFDRRHILVTADRFEAVRLGWPGMFE